MAKKTYSVKLEFTDILSEDPLTVAKDIAQLLITDSFELVYDVEDEETGEKFTVDLSVDDEDAVLPNN